jgi:hypothetical protein
MEVEEFFEHHGIKGQRWGVRKTNREARKDAKEFARAKMFFGEGAGTRRKLINKSVEAKKQRSSAYAKAFDTNLAIQDLSTHASKAKKERKRTDRNTRTKQRVGAVARRLTGEMGTQAAFVAVATGGAAFVASPRGQRFIKSSAAKLKNIQSEVVRRRGASHISKLLRDMT